MIWFAIASLTPAAFLVAACLLGGIWPFLALLSNTLFVFGMDRLVSKFIPDTKGQDGLPLSYALVATHGIVWWAGIQNIAMDVHLTNWDRVFIVLAMGLYFGQVSNSNAHELIHNSARLPRRLGIAVYTSLLFGHHASVHPRVHHIHAATWRDPNTSRLGEGFWTYLTRAWGSGFMEGKYAEDAMRMRSKTPKAAWTHPYVGYLLGSALTIALAAWIAGPNGILTLLVLAAYAQLQLYLSDYVQHYGLLRKVDNKGRTEPMGPQHSWNAPHWYSSAMMLNAPRHSEHHTSPNCAYPDLTLNTDTMPTLPHSLPVMAVLALFPPIWRRIMDARVAQWIGDAMPKVET